MVLASEGNRYEYLKDIKTIITSLITYLKPIYLGT